MGFSLNKTHRKIALIIDGVILTLLGVFFFLTIAGLYVYSGRNFGRYSLAIIIVAILLTLLFIFSGIALIRRNKHGGMIAAGLFGLGLVATFSSYVLSRDLSLILAFFFYAVLLALLVLGWKELK